MVLLWFCYDFDIVDFMFFLLGLKNLMILIWFSYGLGMLQFFVMKIVVAASIVVSKKNTSILLKNYIIVIPVKTFFLFISYSSMC